MKKHFFAFLLFFFFVALGQAQINQSWGSYFSYNHITDLAESESRLYAAGSNAVFSKNILSQELKTITSVDGLKAQNITALYHSNTFKKTLVGNENGLLLVINDATNAVLTKVDILTQIPVAPNVKKINHFLEHEGKVYISCDFGIVVIDLATLEFGDTYYIGPAGQEVRVFETCVLNNTIYAATQNNGIRSASLSNPNLNDFSQWSQFNTGSWIHMTTFNNQIVATDANNTQFRFNGATPQQFASFPDPVVDVRGREEYLVVTTRKAVTVYSATFAVVASFTATQVSATETIVFTSGTLINNTIYVGTDDHGVFSCGISNTSQFDNFYPGGPLRNNVFRIKAVSNLLWCVFGDYNGTYNPYPLDAYGISKFTTNIGWSHIPYSELSGAKSLVYVTPHPTNTKVAYVSSYFTGLLQLENDVLTETYTPQNTSTNGSGLQQATGGAPNESRVNGSAFDRNGNLWMTNSLAEKGLVVMRPGNQWQAYSMAPVMNVANTNSYSKLLIDKNSTKWLASNYGGVIGFNENYDNKILKISEGSDEGNLPVIDVRAIAIDRRNQLWIGTSQGLRILPSVDNFLTETQLTTNPIIILEEDLAQELFFNQFITDIEVDGSNNKWVGTAGAGAFLVSPNGQETKYHFTKDNSPLPGNTINDIDINPLTGEVFFATDGGMVSFKGVATAPTDNLNNVIVFPNPVRPEYQGTVKISGLMTNCNVKITDIEGNLVHEEVSKGGTIEWNTTAFGKYRVASGVYMIFISDNDGTETKVKKVMIIR